MLLAFQKSLARSVSIAQNTLRADPELLLGRRPLYVAEGLEVSLSAAVRTDPAEGATPQSVLLDLDAPPLERSQIKFRIATSPVEAVSAARLEMSQLEPTSETPSITRLRVMLIGEDGRGIKGQPMTLFVVAGDRAAVRLELSTDELGRADVVLEFARRGMAIVASGETLRKRLRLAAADEIFAWAVWAPPLLPTSAATLDSPRPTSSPSLTSNVMRVRIPTQE